MCVMPLCLLPAQEWRGKVKACLCDIPPSQKEERHASFALPECDFWWWMRGTYSHTIGHTIHRSTAKKDRPGPSCSLLQGRLLMLIVCVGVCTFMHEWNMTPVDGTSCFPVGYLWFWHAAQVLIWHHWISWFTNQPTKCMEQFLGLALFLFDTDSIIHHILS